MSDKAYERFVLALRADSKLRPWVLGSFLEEDLDQAVLRYSRSEEFARCWTVFQPYLRRGCRLLDLGTGRGLTSIALARKGVHVTSVEFDPSDVVGVGALASFPGRSGLPLFAIRGDTIQMPFRDNTFDLAFCRSVLHHLNDLGQGIREIWRVLKPGGVFVAYNEHIMGPFSSGKKFLSAHPAVAYGVNERAYPVFTYWRKFQSAGFRRLRFFQPILEFSDFLARVNRKPGIAGWIALPRIGASFGRLLYSLHSLLRRYKRYIIVAEEDLASISIVAHKPIQCGTGEY